MLRILVKHTIYELCLEVIFSNVHTNFQKPIPEKEQVIGKMIANILYAAKKVHENTKHDGANFMIASTHIANQIGTEIDKSILESMFEETKK